MMEGEDFRRYGKGWRCGSGSSISKVNSDPDTDPIWIQGFDGQKLKEKNSSNF
jgi:hypothetical protein